MSNCPGGQLSEGQFSLGTIVRTLVGTDARYYSGYFNFYHSQHVLMNDQVDNNKFIGTNQRIKSNRELHQTKHLSPWFYILKKITSIEIPRIYYRNIYYCQNIFMYQFFVLTFILYNDISISARSTTPVFLFYANTISQHFIAPMWSISTQFEVTKTHRQCVLLYTYLVIMTPEL